MAEKPAKQGKGPKPTPTRKSPAPAKGNLGPDQAPFKGSQERSVDDGKVPDEGAEGEVTGTQLKSDD